MNWDRIEAEWDEFKDLARDQWSRLTPDDLDDIGGRRDRLIERVHDLYGAAKEEAAQDVDRWAKVVKRTLDHARLSEEVERLKAEIARLSHSAGEKIREKKDDAAGQANALGKELEAAIERNPMQAVLIAAGVGLVLGWLTRSNKT